MSRDKLEQFIRDHRDEFDEFDPDPALFHKFKGRQPLLHRINWNNVAWKAAAVIIIFVGSYFFHDYMSRKPAGNLAAENMQESEESTEIVRMLIEAEAYYSALIDSRKEEFYHLTVEKNHLRQEINYELVELDSVYAELRRDLKDNAANQEVIEAMIQNYRIKLDILEDVLSQLEQSKQKENQRKQDHEVEL